MYKYHYKDQTGYIYALRDIQIDIDIDRVRDRDRDRYAYIHVIFQRGHEFKRENVSVYRRVCGRKENGEMMKLYYNLKTK